MILAMNHAHFFIAVGFRGCVKIGFISILFYSVIFNQFQKCKMKVYATFQLYFSTFLNKSCMFSMFINLFKL
jgi:hypothetical protein